MPPVNRALPPTRWGNEEVVPELLGDAVTDVSTRTHVVTQRFRPPEAFADFMLTYYGPTYTAASRLDEQGRVAFGNDIIALATDTNRATDGTFVTDWAYRVISAVKPPNRDGAQSNLGATTQQAVARSSGRGSADRYRPGRL